MMNFKAPLMTEGGLSSEELTLSEDDQAKRL